MTNFTGITENLIVAKRLNSVNIEKIQVIKDLIKTT